MRCPMCNASPVGMMGTLGNLRWFRCRCCGAEFSRKVEQGRKKKAGPKK
jgi:transposase-like protein